MNTRIIFFSNDRLGDYLIRSNMIYQISKYYTNKEIVCSEMNYKLISKQLFFNKIFLFDKMKNYKFTFIKKFFFKRYDAAISFDGKSLSLISILIIRAKFKYIFIYKKKGILNNIFLIMLKNLFNLLNIKFTVLNSRAIIEEGQLDNYPEKYKILANYFKISRNTYFVNDISNNLKHNFNDDFILIHLDEKFEDIFEINKNFTNELIKFSKISKYKIILTSFNNTSKYYKNLLIKKISSSNFFNTNSLIDKILIVENLPIENFFYLLKESKINISCHAGFVVHSSLFLNKNYIDIINFKDEKWIDTWITPSEKYKRVYKSNFNNDKFNIEHILNKIIELNNEI